MKIIECMHFLFIGVSGTRLLSEVTSHSAYVKALVKLAVIWSLTAILPSVPIGTSRLYGRILFVLQSRPMYRPMSGWTHLSKHKKYILFLDIERSPVDVIHSQGTQEHPHCIQSIAWQLMTWRGKEPGHQQPLCWPNSLDISAFSITRVKWVFVCLCCYHFRSIHLFLEVLVGGTTPLQWLLVFT